MSTPRHIVGVSGGKDSVALALALRGAEPRDYEYICNWTGNELPDMAAHMARIEALLGKPIRRVTYRFDLFGLIDELGMIPNFRARFCTRVLKIEPTIAFFESLPPESVLYVGLRADEEERKGLYGDDVRVRYPMREWGWTEADVWRYLDARGICIPKRTNCAVCYDQQIGEWHDLYQNHPVEYARGVAAEITHGHTFRSDKRDTWPASLLELAQEFESGRKLRRRAKAARACRVCSV
jgi:3'-phosphoadenosine 5'-phosphosulfate sulfotransferase (PAPS reductase)/FAD synthetase